jgi:hypothetical protein
MTDAQGATGMIDWRRIREQLANAYRRRRKARLLKRAERAVARFPSTARKAASGLAGPLIVSLTSYPPRFPALARTLKSLLDQDIRADRTILWLAHVDIPALPADVRALEAHGLEIRGCTDLLSYKKLILALQAFPDAFIVTADDDAYYAPDWLGQLVEAYRSGPPAVIGGRAHLARFGADGALLPYAAWELDTRATEATAPATALFPTGCGGILYPPGSLAPQVADEAVFMDLCRHGDDIWFFFMQRLIGTRQRKIPGLFRQVSWEESQDVGLFHENVVGGRNDSQIRNLEARFGRI